MRLLAAAVVLCMVAPGLWTVFQLERTEDTLESTRELTAQRTADLDRTTRRLDVVGARLDEVQEEMTGVARRLGRIHDRLDLRTTERNQHRNGLRRTRRELQDVSEQLGGAQYVLDLYGGEVLALRACMTGVSQALLQIGLTDAAGAARSLAAVSATCVLAEGTIGDLAGGA